MFLSVCSEFMQFYVVLIFIFLQTTMSATSAFHMNIKNETTRELQAQSMYHQKIYKFNETYPSPYKHFWMALETVDGLKNEEVVVLVTSTGVQGFLYLRERIISSSRTWMKMFANRFVMVEDDPNVRFALRHCSVRETNKFTSFDCQKHNEPTYVLSRKCTNDYYGGPGPCCKVDDLFSYLIFDRPEIYEKTKFVLHGDDDTYWRPDQTLRWLAAIDQSGINTLPIIASHNGNDAPDHKEHVWHIDGCEEIHTNGWYQPMMLNHAALDRLKFASQSYGLAATCKNFDVTHDVGMGPYAWLFGLVHMQIPAVEIYDTSKKEINQDHMVKHAVKHARDVDNCNNKRIWPADNKHRFKQNIVVGCGDIDEPSPGHDAMEGKATNGEPVVADMYDVWDFFKHHPKDRNPRDGWIDAKVTLYPNATVLPGITTKGAENGPQIKHILTDQDVIAVDGTFQGDIVETRRIPNTMKLEGYSSTAHAKKHNILKDGGWSEFKMSDCKIKGNVHQGRRTLRKAF